MCSREILVAEKTITSTIAWPVPEPVAIAVIVSCVGAALQCLAGAPQLLEAIAKDDLVSYLSIFAPAKLMNDASRSNGEGSEEGDLEHGSTGSEDDFSSFDDDDEKGVGDGADNFYLNSVLGMIGGASERALLVTALTAALPCLLGNLDFITPIVTMFFLLMYASINLACFLLAAQSAPGFRPTFKLFHWTSALWVILTIIQVIAVQKVGDQRLTAKARP